MDFLGVTLIKIRHTRDYLVKVHWVCEKHLCNCNLSLFVVFRLGKQRQGDKEAGNKWFIMEARQKTDIL